MWRLFCGRAGLLRARNGGSRPGQTRSAAPGITIGLFSQIKQEVVLKAGPAPLQMVLDAATGEQGLE